MILSPLHFILETNKETFVANMWEFSSEEVGWTPRFIRTFNYWEVEEVQCLLQSIQDKRVLASQDDMILLKEARDGRFSVKLLYRVLDQSDNVVSSSIYLEFLGFH